MTADFSLVTHTAETYAHIFAPCRARNRPRNACFAHSGRSEQAEYASGRPVGKLEHRKLLDNPLFHLFHAAVILIKDAARFFHIGRICIVYPPREIAHHLKIVARDGAFGGCRRQPFKVFQFIKRLFARFLRHRCAVNFIAEHIGFRKFILAKLRTDCLKLLAQIVVVVVIVHLLFNAVCDNILHFKDFNLARHNIDKLLKALLNVRCFKNYLLILKPAQKISGNRIRKRGRVILRQRLLKRFRRKLRIKRYEIIYQRMYSVQKRRIFLGRKVSAAAVFALDEGFVKLLRFKRRNYSAARYTLGKNTHTALMQAHHLLYLCNCAESVNIALRRLVKRCVLLRRKENISVSGNRLLDCRYAFFPCHIEMKCHFRENNKSAHGNNG